MLFFGQAALARCPGNRQPETAEAPPGQRCPLRTRRYRDPTQMCLTEIPRRLRQSHLRGLRGAGQRSLRLHDPCRAAGQKGRPPSRMSNVWNRVDIVLTTHDTGGLSLRDLALARAIDARASLAIFGSCFACIVRGAVRRILRKYRHILVNFDQLRFLDRFALYIVAVDRIRTNDLPAPCPNFTKCLWQ